ncbi:MAG: class I SAM-dependent methyltransferase [Candidatus Cloacimonetes bacterium]|nr:class I SAM-dependent methyltransferase [Candidatus Cloacimonadota bacterium]
MLELLKIDLKNKKEYQEINKELIEICKRSHSLKEAEEGLAKSQYMLDYPWIISHLPEITGKKILDAGGGRGVLQIYLALKGAKLHNCDRRVEHCKSWVAEKAKQFKIKIHFKDSNLMNTGYCDEAFDYIVSCSALEHNSFDDAKLVFKELERILKPGGLIVFTLEAWKEFKVTYGTPQDPVITCYTDKKIKELTEGTDLSLLNNENNFDQFEDFITDILNEHPVCNRLQLMPIGVVFYKAKKL